MLYQCVSQTIYDSWWRGFLIWSDKCVPLSLEVIMISALFLYFLGFIHKALIPFLKKTHVYKLMTLEKHEISNLEVVSILKLIILVSSLGIYLLFIFASSWFLADFILNCIGWTADMRFYII